MYVCVCLSIVQWRSWERCMTLNRCRRMTWHSGKETRWKSFFLTTRQYRPSLPIITKRWAASYMYSLVSVYRSVCLSVSLSVCMYICMYVCNTITFESFGLESLFLICMYIFRGYRSSVKVIGSRSRLKQQKRVKHDLAIIILSLLLLSSL